MKIIYLCSVIVVSCGVCASGDLEIYPGLKVDLSDEDSRNRLRDYERRAYFPFQNLDDLEKLEERRKVLAAYGPYPETELYPETIARKRHYREDVDWKQYKLRNYHKNRQHLDALIPKYVLDKHRLPILSEPKMHYQTPLFSDYQDRDDNFDSDEEGGGDLFSDRLGSLPFDGLRLDEDDKKHEEHDMHHVVDPNAENEGESFSSGRFKDVKTAEDPTDFAYVPPDPRFYRSNGAAEKDIVPQPEDTPESSPEPPLKVNQRSEMKADNDLKISDQNETPRSASESLVELVDVQPSDTNVDTAEVYIIAIVAGISAAATVGLIAVGIGWYNLRKHVKNAQDVDYPAYGITGPNKDLSPSGDRRLAQSAQMYHYQHQKQQIIAMERAPPGERNGSVSDGESDEENEEGDYTVYECPGLAPTGEMEVKNPLFQDDPTPAQTPATKTSTDEKN